jgi:ketosteroid isomerase-like protein
MRNRIGSKSSRGFKWQSAALFMCLGLGLALGGHAATADSELALFKQAIRAKYDMKEQAFAARDVESILTRFYAEDVISTDPDGHTHIGRDALRPIYEEVIGSTVRIEPFRSFVRGDAGWDWVNFHVTPPPEAKQEPFTFKMLFLWERIAGEWWSHGEMYVVGEFATH